MSIPTSNACALFLESGQLFVGTAFGARDARGGEIVFNTGLTGYQEILTDPSYCEQIVTMTYPHIGNTGTNPEDVESSGLALAGLVVRSYCAEPSNWRSTKTLDAYLQKAGVPGITGVDTREITRMLRTHGAQRAVIFPLEKTTIAEAQAKGTELLRHVTPMEGRELVSRVSCRSAYEYEPGEGPGGLVVVYDFGVKTNSLRHFRARGFRVKVVPFNTSAEDTLAMKPDAVMLSNGPGDPATVPDAVLAALKGLIGRVPLFAICMGHQLLARALGISTFKLPFGHHGVNHPVKDLRTGRILVTSQNHGFATKEEDFAAVKDVKITHVSLNDHTVEGFVSDRLRLSSVQFHPESAPGPSDAAYLFDDFIKGYVK